MTKTLGQRVAEKRTQRGYTQKELAETIKRMFPYFKGGQSTIQAIESGQSKKPTILYELARSLNCSEQYLMTGVESSIDKKGAGTDLERLEKEVAELTRGPHPLPARPAADLQERQARLQRMRQPPQPEPQENVSSEISRTNVQRFASAVLGSYQMLGLDKAEAEELLEIVSEVAVEPLISETDGDELESRRLLAASLTRRFLRTKHAQ